MTKTVRIENACNSNYKLKVTTEELQADGTWRQNVPTNYNSNTYAKLDYPTMQAEILLYKGRRLIVEEYE